MALVSLDGDLYLQELSFAQLCPLYMYVYVYEGDIMCKSYLIGFYNLSVKLKVI